MEWLLVSKEVELCRVSTLRSIMWLWTYHCSSAVRVYLVAAVHTLAYWAATFSFHSSFRPQNSVSHCVRTGSNAGCFHPHLGPYSRVQLLLACTNCVGRSAAVDLPPASRLALVKSHSLCLGCIIQFGPRLALEIDRTAAIPLIDLAGPVGLIFAAALLAEFVVLLLLILG